MTLAALFVLIPNVPPLLGSACTLGFYVPIIHRLFVLDVRMLRSVSKQSTQLYILEWASSQPNLHVYQSDGAGCVHVDGSLLLRQFETWFLM